MKTILDDNKLLLEKKKSKKNGKLWK
jgi:hypothetical protein